MTTPMEIPTATKIPMPKMAHKMREEIGWCIFQAYDLAPYRWMVPQKQAWKMAEVSHACLILYVNSAS